MKVRMNVTLSVPSGVFLKGSVVEKEKKEFDKYLLKEIEFGSDNVEVLEDEDEKVVEEPKEEHKEEKKPEPKTVKKGRKKKTAPKK